MAIDAKSIHEPITFSAHDITPVLEMSQKENPKSVARLTRLAEKNNGERQRLVDHLLKLMGRR